MPDRRSRELIGDAVTWAIENPEAIDFHSSSKEARYGHLPNMVAFKNLIDGIEEISKRWRKPVKRIVHDEQMQFEKNFKLWHKIYSNASPEPLHWPGEPPRILRVVNGSTFEMLCDTKSPGIQVIDTVLWVLKRALDEKEIGPESAGLLNYAARRAVNFDLSFETIASQLRAQQANIFSSDPSPEQLAAGEELRRVWEDRRREQMADYHSKKSLAQ